jgi:putative tryptophan/tyrosine transport system substrate-binding protein
MRRRDFIAGVATTTAAWPLATRAQQPAMPVIGFLNGGSPDGFVPMVAAFREGLKETGDVEGQNLSIEFRWANGQYDRLPALAEDLIRRQVSVIAANTPANLVAKAATSTIPIVFTTGSDPVELGLVASLDRPGGNVTGATQLNVEIAPKRLELAHELVPTATVIALLVNPTNSTQAAALTRASQAAAKTLGLELVVLHASTETQLDDAFTSILQKRAGALVIGTDTFFNSHLERLGALAIRHSVPAIYAYRSFVSAGGLVSYSGSVTDSYRLTGGYAGRILKGERPADLPVQESTKVELVVNLKTAKALGLTIPLSLLGRADEVSLLLQCTLSVHGPSRRPTHASQWPLLGEDRSRLFGLGAVEYDP